MLEQRGVEYVYREYTERPLSAEEIANVIRKLGVPAASLLRTRDKAYAEAGITGHESEARLVALMAEHPTLLQRPIVIDGERALLCRPAERLEEWL